MSKQVDKLLKTMLAAFLILALLSLFLFRFVNMSYEPDGYWLIPAYFLLLTLVLGLIVGHKEKQKKELSVANILGVRFMFISLILIFVIILFLANRAQAINIAAHVAIYSIIFLFFETKVLLAQNKRHQKSDQTEQ